MLKTLIKGSIFLIVEFYFYSKTSPASLESFFFGWGFLFISIFLYNAFGAAFEGSAMSSAGGGKGNLMNVTNQHNSNISNALLARGSQAFNGILDRVNLLYLVLFIINVIAYIRIMPK